MICSSLRYTCELSLEVHTISWSIIWRLINATSHLEILSCYNNTAIAKPMSNSPYTTDEKR